MRTLPRLLILTALVVLSAACAKSKSHADTTPPTPPGGVSLSVTTAGMSALTIVWAAATDDVTVPATLEYRAFLSTAANLSTVADIEANGTPLGNYATGLYTATATGLSTQTGYWFNVIVRDEAGNRAAYSAVQGTTAGSCADDPPGGCPAPDAGQMSICGRLYDAGSSAQLTATIPTGSACTAVTADGPCSLRIQFFDATAFAANPGGAPPIVPSSLEVDDCGRYRARNIAPPGSSYLSVVVDDAPATTARHRLTGVMTATSPATQANLSLWATTIATDSAWTSSAGLSGPTFADRGVLALVFRYQGAPRGGVQVRRNGSLISADDYYFSDTDGARTTVAASLTVTGSNGTALIVNGASPATYDGAGNEPGGCLWPAALGVTIPGAVSFQRSDAQTTGGAACP